MFLIKSDDQRQKTLKHIEGLKTQVGRIRQKHGPERARHFATAASRKIREFEEQVKEYDRLKQEGPGAFRPQDVSEIGAYLIRARVASGITQAELAKRLDVSQPMVHKCRGRRLILRAETRQLFCTILLLPNKKLFLVLYPPIYTVQVKFLMPATIIY